MLICYCFSVYCKLVVTKQNQNQCNIPIAFTHPVSDHLENIRFVSQPKTSGTQRLFSVKYLFGEPKIAYNFLLLEEG